MTITETKPRRAARASKAQQAADTAHAEQLAQHRADIATWTARLDDLGKQIGEDPNAWTIARPPTSNPETWNTAPLRYWMFEAALRWNEEMAALLTTYGKPTFCVQCAVEAGEGRPGPTWAASKCFDHAWKDYLAGEAWERAKTHGGKA